MKTTSKCPFCNSESITYDHKKDRNRLVYSVRCNNCFASGPTVSEEIPDNISKPERNNIIVRLTKRASDAWNSIPKKDNEEIIKF